MPKPPRDAIPTLTDLDLVIQTDRLTLRPLTDGDVEDLWPWVSDPDFPRHMTWNAHVDRAQTRAFIAAGRDQLANGAGITWGIEHEGRASGCIGLHDIRWQMLAWRLDRAELGYWLARPLWGRGLMAEAARAVVQFGFDRVGLHKVTVNCLAVNDASRRVIENVGFRYVGRREEDVWRDDQWHGRLFYELTVSEWTT